METYTCTQIQNRDFDLHIHREIVAYTFRETLVYLERDVLYIDPEREREKTIGQKCFYMQKHIPTLTDMGLKTHTKIYMGKHFCTHRDSLRCVRGACKVTYTCRSTRAFTEMQACAQRQWTHTHIESRRDGYGSLSRYTQRHIYRFPHMQVFHTDVQIDMETHRHPPEQTQRHTETRVSVDLCT